MVNREARGKAAVFMAGVLVFTCLLSSCDTLKQKFIRKKKAGTAEDQGFIPVLEPEEYPSPATNPQLNYKEHYDLVKAWYKDLWTAIDDRSSPKYVHYIISQVRKHVGLMEDLVDGPTKAQLEKLAGMLNYYESSLERSWQARNVERIQSDLRSFDRQLRDHLRIDRIQGHFVALPAVTDGKSAK